MARVAKDYEARRGELIDAAWALFTEHGYENTTVSAIIDACDISKGTFYHYFGSKEELLDATIERITISIRDAIEGAISVQGLTAVEKMARLIDASRVYKTEHAEVLGTLVSVIYSDENLLLRHKMHARTVELLSPAFTLVIEQGVDEGVFDVRFPAETAEMILQLGNAFAELNVTSMMDMAGRPEMIDRLTRRIRVYATTVERVLGAPEDSFEIYNERSIKLLKKLAQATGRASNGSG